MSSRTTRKNLNNVNNFFYLNIHVLVNLIGIYSQIKISFWQCFGHTAVWPWPSYWPFSRSNNSQNRASAGIHCQCSNRYYFVLSYSPLQSLVFFCIYILFAGESVKVINLPIKPFIPPDYKQLFDKWKPVYRDFRFNEAFEFRDFEETSSVNRICLSAKQDHPRCIQCVRLYEEECFFKLTISKLGRCNMVSLKSTSLRQEVNRDPLGR